jgi:DNA-binding beta-propeller fold protein YncE
MKKAHAILLTLFLVVAVRVDAQANNPLKLLHTTPLPDFKGDLDHFAVDLNGNRLFVTAEVHKTVEVFDLKTGERIHSITGFGTPHEILFRPDSNTLIVADGGGGQRVQVGGWKKLSDHR